MTRTLLKDLSTQNNKSGKIRKQIIVVCELGVSRQFGSKKSHKKNQHYSQRF